MALGELNGGRLVQGSERVTRRKFITLGQPSFRDAAMLSAVLFTSPVWLPIVWDAALLGLDLLGRNSAELVDESRQSSSGLEKFTGEVWSGPEIKKIEVYKSNFIDFSLKLGIPRSISTKRSKEIEFQKKTGASSGIEAWADQVGDGKILLDPNDHDSEQLVYFALTKQLVSVGHADSLTSGVASWAVYGIQNNQIPNVSGDLNDALEDTKAYYDKAAASFARVNFKFSRSSENPYDLVVKMALVVDTYKSQYGPDAAPSYGEFLDALSRLDNRVHSPSDFNKLFSSAEILASSLPK